MMILTPIFSLVSMMITLTQESHLSHITKDYITISMISNIDVMFVDMLSSHFIPIADMLNKDGGFEIPKDLNKNRDVFRRIQKAKCSPDIILSELTNILINLWCGLLVNF